MPIKEKVKRGHFWDTESFFRAIFTTVRPLMNLAKGS
jgi:hypothetical protein